MDKSLNILVLTTSFPLKEGIAVGIHVLEKCRVLVELGHEVTVIAPHHKGGKKEEIIDGISVKRFSYFTPSSLQILAYGSGIPSNLKRSFLARIQLPFLLLSFFLKALPIARKSDIIHAHWSIAGLVAVWTAKLTRRPTVLSMHGAEVFVKGKNRVLRSVLTKVNLVVFNSTFTEKKVREHYHVRSGVVIHPGCDTDRFKATPDEGLKTKLSIADGDVFLLSIGKFIPRKGFEYLIEAMRILVSERGLRNIQLRIGGRGYLKGSLMKMVDEKHLKERLLV